MLLVNVSKLPHQHQEIILRIVTKVSWIVYFSYLFVYFFIILCGWKCFLNYCTFYLLVVAYKVIKLFEEILIWHLDYCPILLSFDHGLWMLPYVLLQIIIISNVFLPTNWTECALTWPWEQGMPGSARIFTSK